MEFEDTDEGLVKAFQKSDQKAFNELVIRYKDKVFNLCYRFLDDYEEAKDVAQDIFLKVFISLKGFRGESRFSTWLYRISMNTCKNRVKSFRYRFRSKTVQLMINEDKEAQKGVHDIVDNTMSPSDCLEKSQRDLLIQQALDTLPPAQRTVIILRHMEGLSYEEIAEITGLNLGTVKSKLSRARLNLSKRLKGVL